MQYLGHLETLACVATAWEVGRLPSHIEHGVYKGVRWRAPDAHHGFGLVRGPILSYIALPNHMSPKQQASSAWPGGNQSLTLLRSCVLGRVGRRGMMSGMAPEAEAQPRTS
jgi:hypothetical protein